MFSFDSVVSIDPLLRSEFLLLLLRQGDRSLKDHTRLFWLLASTTRYLDDPLSEDGPREDFVAFVEWTLARNILPHG